MAHWDAKKGDAMTGRGMHHLGLATPDYEGTVEFYHEVLGFEIAWQDQLFRPDGSEQMRHVFFDLGNDNLLAFACSVPGSTMFPETWATDIGSGLGVPAAAYHIALRLDSEEELEAKMHHLRSRGVETTIITDHGWCKSIYFKDPNGLLLEYCVTTRVFNDDDDKLLKPRVQPGFKVADEETALRYSRILGIPEEIALARVVKPESEPVST